MEGFKGYQHRVKIGNWSEDMELEAVCTFFNHKILTVILTCTWLNMNVFKLNRVG